MMEKKISKEEEKKPNEKKSLKKGIVRLWKNPRGKSSLFFLFYLAFFLLIIIGIRSNFKSNHSSNINSLQNNITTNYKLDGIYKGNYYFTRIETLNGIATQFEGKSNDQKSEVVGLKNGILSHYFMYGGIVIEQKEGTYKVSSDPYLYGKFGMYRYIDSILEKATLISKTDYPDGNSHYQYEISTTTLVKLFDNIDIDLEDPSNRIEVEVGADHNVVGITYQLDAYASYTSGENISLEIKLTYDRFGEVEELEVPESL